MTVNSADSSIPSDRSLSRRHFLTTVGGAATAGLAGCSSGDDNSDDDGTETSSDPAFDPVTIEVPPTATYLRTNNDAADDTTPIPLTEQPFGPGDRVTLERLGEFDNGSPSGTAGLGMHAVASTSSTLRSQSEFRRVPDAINVGGYHQTSRTYYGGLWTSIRADFLVADNEETRTSITVDIPEEATHLFVAAKDNLYEDNSVAADQFAVRISDGSGQSPATTSGDEAPAELPPQSDQDSAGGETPVVDPETTVSLDPTATYLRTSNDAANDATPVVLSEHGLSPGDNVTLSVQGTYGNGQGDQRKRTVAVFSGSEELGPSEDSARVIDAIDAGVDVETPASYNGNTATDIPEDFAVAVEGSFSSVTLAVPDGATHLFVSPRDDFFEDNSGEEYALGITTEA